MVRPSQAELLRWLQKVQYPIQAEQLREQLTTQHAPDSVQHSFSELPEQQYHRPEAALAAIGPASF